MGSFPLRGCADQTDFTFADSSQSPDGSSLKHYWTFGDGDIDSGSVVKHIYKAIGTYAVVLVSKSPWCQSSTSANQLVDPTVHATFRTDTMNQETRRFTATDTLIKGYTYHWFFENGQSGFGNPVTHTYLHNNTFDVSLKVSNAIGCIDSSGRNIKINSPNYRQVENALNFYVYPNPTNGSFTYKFEIKDKRTVTVKLYDVKGQTALYEKTWTDAEPGTYYEMVNMKSLGFSAGTYPLVLISGADKVEEKIVYTGGQ